MTTKTAVKLSLANIISDGLDDVLPTPFEMALLKKEPELQRQLKEDAINKIETYLSCGKSQTQRKAAFDQLSLMPLSHVLVPKKEAFDYRKIAIIGPDDLILFQAAAIMIAEPFERIRRGIARARVFSYRFKPHAKSGRLFSPAHNFRTFQKKAATISTQKDANYIVKSDISNFYDRVNLHRLESTLLAINGIDTTLVDLVNQILLHWAMRNSYGLPIGSNASRVLAEVALFNVDRHLANAGLTFIRFVDDYRIFTRTAAEAHSALAMLIELLDREGLFINTRKSSIERLENAKPEQNSEREEKVRAEKIEVREFRILAGYGGTIPTRFRRPAKKSHGKYVNVDLGELITGIKDDDFASPEQLRDLLYGIVIQGKYSEILTACDLVELFPQFYPLLVDMLIKNAEHIPREVKSTVVDRLSKRLLSDEFLPEYLKASLVELAGSEEYFHREVVVAVIRNMRRNEGAYFGRASFDAAQNLMERADALEIREYFDRSNQWERRRIVRVMKAALSEQEYRAWRRAVRPYLAKDRFALAI